jgi:hypothetical protein
LDLATSPNRTAAAMLLVAADPADLPSTIGARPAIPAADSLAPYLRDGQGQISGTLIASTRLFGRIVCENAPVYLIPETPFTRWYVLQMADDLSHKIQTSRHYPAAPQRFTHVVRTSKDGRFVFTNLPPRKYLVNASVSREESATPIIKRHRMGYDLNGDPVSVPVSTTGLPIKSEADVLAASAELSSPDDGVVIDAFP